MVEGRKSTSDDDSGKPQLYPVPGVHRLILPSVLGGGYPLAPKTGQYAKLGIHAGFRYPAP